VHSLPADFTLGGKALTVIGRDLGGLAEGCGDFFRVAGGILSPLLDTELGGIDPDDTAFTNTVIVEDFGDAAADSDGVEKFLILRGVAHGRITNGPRPDRCDERANVESVALDLISDDTQIGFARIRIGVREEEKVIDAVVFLTVDFSGSRQFKHAVERNRGFLTFVVAFSDETGPHGIMEFEIGHILEEWVFG
jgi:hypothetical protein